MNTTEEYSNHSDLSVTRWYTKDAVARLVEKADVKNEQILLWYGNEVSQHICYFHDRSINPQHILWRAMCRTDVGCEHTRRDTATDDWSKSVMCFLLHNMASQRTGKTAKYGQEKICTPTRPIVVL